MSKTTENINITQYRKRGIDDLRIDLNDYFSKQFGYKKPPCKLQIHNTLSYRKAEFDLCLHYYEDPRYEGMVLEISRIGFRVSKVVHATRFLRYIVQISEKYNIKYVAVKQTLSKAGFALIRSLGLINNPSWIISIEELQHNLSKKKEINEI